jgi:hypothetical protein
MKATWLMKPPYLIQEYFWSARADTVYALLMADQSLVTLHCTTINWLRGRTM